MKKDIKDIVIRFAGDSGDGMQLTGTMLSSSSAKVGLNTSTFPDFPAEIRAPSGTVSGVSGFQVHIGSGKVNTPGDKCDVLIAMNPAALKASLNLIKKDTLIIVDETLFTDSGFKKASIESDDASVFSFLGVNEKNVIKIPIISLVKEAVKDLNLDSKSITKSRNMFALGVCFYLFNFPLEIAIEELTKKFKNKLDILELNKIVVNAGWNYCDNVELQISQYILNKEVQEKGVYCNISGNTATAWGLIAAAEKSNLGLFCGSYPITPATAVLEELAKRKDLGVIAVQTEDEIAGICVSIGAAYGGKLAITSTSGPGFALKTEALGLAIMMELPLVVVNVQRTGPSTGLPTKSEQGDLLQALWGRNGDSPLVVMAATSPADCYFMAYWASKIALESMVPVVLLTDSFIGNGTESFNISKAFNLPEIKVRTAKKIEGEEFMPYRRDVESLARNWAIPGMKDMMHRVGGLEKEDVTGIVSHNAENHQKMANIRKEKVDRVANVIPQLEIFGNKNAKTLVVGWGGTKGHLLEAIEFLNTNGEEIAMVCFSFISPMPKNSYDILSKYSRIIVCELNQGQFVILLREKFPDLKFETYNKTQGLPFTKDELVNKITSLS